MTGKDLYGNITPNISNVIALSVNHGTVTPSSINNTSFFGGTYTGDITISGISLGSSVTLTASTDNGTITKTYDIDVNQNSGGSESSSINSINVIQMVSSEITITSPDNVVMSPTIAGMTGGTGTGSATWTVTTNNLEGFEMSIKSDTNPALKSPQNNSFANYTPSGTVPDFTWNVADTDSEFGYTVEPHTVEDTAPAFLDNGSLCGTGTANATDKCWFGFATADKTIVHRTSETPQLGEAETVKFKAQSGPGHYQTEGDYVATITVTALMN
jgi:hypothetical protein